MTMTAIKKTYKIQKEYMIVRSVRFPAIGIKVDFHLFGLLKLMNNLENSFYRSTACCILNWQGHRSMWSN